MLPKVYLTARLVPNHTQPRVVPSKDRVVYPAAEAAIAKRLHGSEHASIHQRTCHTSA